MNGPMQILFVAAVFAAALAVAGYCILDWTMHQLPRLIS